jgi:hypothetical protein
VGEMVMPIGIKIEMPQYGYIMPWPWVSNVDVNQETLVVNNDHVVHQVDFFLPLNQVWCVTLFQRLQRVSTKVPSMNLMQDVVRSRIPLAKVTLSLTINHWISFAIPSLMHDEMNIISSQIEILDQFYMNASCMVTLSCLKYSMKFKRHCFSVNLHGLPKGLQTSLVNLAWLMIFGTTSVANS